MDSSNDNKGKPTSIRARLKYPNEQSFIERYAPNISKTGIFVKTARPKPVGAQIRFEFQIADGTPVLRGAGEVVWNRTKASDARPTGMGVKFLGLDAKSKQILTRVLEYKRTSGGGAAKPSRYSDGPGPGQPIEAADDKQPSVVPEASEPESAAAPAAAKELEPEQPAEESISKDSAEEPASEPGSSLAPAETTTSDEGIEEAPTALIEETDEEGPSQAAAKPALKRRRWRTSSVKKPKIDFNQIDSMLADITTTSKKPKRSIGRLRQRSALPQDAVATATELLESVLAKTDGILKEEKKPEETQKTETDVEQPSSVDIEKLVSEEEQVEPGAETEPVSEEEAGEPVAESEPEDAVAPSDDPVSEDTEEAESLAAEPPVAGHDAAPPDAEPEEEIQPVELDDSEIELISENDIEEIKERGDIEAEMDKASQGPPTKQSDITTEDSDISYNIAMLDAQEDEEAETLSFMPESPREDSDELEAQFQSVLEEDSEEDEETEGLILEEVIEVAPSLPDPFAFPQAEVSSAMETQQVIDLNSDMIVIDKTEDVEVEVEIEFEQANLEEDLLVIDEDNDDFEIIAEIEQGDDSGELAADDQVSNLLHQVTSDNVAVSLTPSDPLLLNDDVSEALDTFFDGPSDGPPSKVPDLPPTAPVEEEINLDDGGIDTAIIVEETDPGEPIVEQKPFDDVTIDETPSQDGTPPKRISFLKKIFGG